MINIEFNVDEIKKEVEDKIKARIEIIVDDISEELVGIDTQGHKNIEYMLISTNKTVTFLESQIGGYKENVDKYTGLIEGIIKQETDPYFMIDIYKEMGRIKDKIDYVQKQNDRLENEINEIRKVTGVGNVFE